MTLTLSASEEVIESWPDRRGCSSDTNLGRICLERSNVDSPLTERQTNRTESVQHSSFLFHANDITTKYEHMTGSKWVTNRDELFYSEMAIGRRSDESFRLLIHSMSANVVVNAFDREHEQLASCCTIAAMHCVRRGKKGERNWLFALHFGWSAGVGFCICYRNIPMNQQVYWMWRLELLLWVNEKKKEIRRLRVCHSSLAEESENSRLRCK